MDGAVRQLVEAAQAPPPMAVARGKMRDIGAACRDAFLAPRGAAAIAPSSLELARYNAQQSMRGPTAAHVLRTDLGATEQANCTDAAWLEVFIRARR